MISQTNTLQRIAITLALGFSLALIGSLTVTTGNVAAKSGESTKVITGDKDCTDFRYFDEQGFRCSKVDKKKDYCKQLKAHAVVINGDQKCIKKGSKACTKDGKPGNHAIYGVKNKKTKKYKIKYTETCFVREGKPAGKL